MSNSMLVLILFLSRMTIDDTEVIAADFGV